MTLIAPAVLNTVKPLFAAASFLLLADDASFLLLADGTSKLVLTVPADSSIDSLQDISALGTLALTDLMYGVQPGAPDEDFQVDITTIKAFYDAGVGKDGTVLGTATANADTSIVFENGVGGVVFDGTYKRYKLIGSGIYITNSTAGQDMYMQIKRSGQPSFDTASGYAYANQGIFYDINTPPPAYDYRQSSNSGFARIVFQVPYTSTNTAGIEIEFFDITSSNYKVFKYREAHGYSAGDDQFRCYEGGAIRRSSDALIAFQLVMSGNHPFSGEFTLIGYND